MKTFREQLEAARAWEIRVGAWLNGMGWYVLPTYDFSGKGEDKAPKLIAPKGRRGLVIPDLACFKRETTGRWAEVKFKTAADWYRNGSRWVTGISRRHFAHYNRVERLSGMEVYILFVHEAEREIRGATLARLKDELHSHTYRGNRMGPGGMVFFRYAEIPRWGSLRELKEAA